MTKSRGIRNTSHDGRCSVEDCVRRYYAKGLCRVHWERQHHSGRLGTVGVERGSNIAQRLAHYSKAEGSCIVFTGYRDSDGYGHLTIDGEYLSAHRLAWIEANGTDIPPGMLVRHRCDNPPCINPEHLELGTEADNARDKVERGRSLPGTANPAAKLSDEQVAAIKAGILDGATNASLATAYGVGTSTISRIRRGVAWSKP